MSRHSQRGRRFGARGSAPHRSIRRIRKFLSEAALVTESTPAPGFATRDPALDDEVGAASHAVAVHGRPGAFRRYGEIREGGDVGQGLEHEVSSPLPP